MSIICISFMILKNEKSINSVFFPYGQEKSSDKPIINNRTSVRLMEQITLFNKVTGAKRFSGRILIRSIKGRRLARQAEDNIILKFKRKHGRFPRGNEGHKFLKD